MGCGSSVVAPLHHHRGDAPFDSLERRRVVAAPLPQPQPSPPKQSTPAQTVYAIPDEKESHVDESCVPAPQRASPVIKEAAPMTVPKLERQRTLPPPVQHVLTIDRVTCCSRALLIFALHAAFAPEDVRIVFEEGSAAAIDGADADDTSADAASDSRAAATTNAKSPLSSAAAVDCWFAARRRAALNLRTPRLERSDRPAWVVREASAIIRYLGVRFELTPRVGGWPPAPSAFFPGAAAVASSLSEAAMSGTISGADAMKSITQTAASGAADATSSVITASAMAIDGGSPSARALRLDVSDGAIDHTSNIEVGTTSPLVNGNVCMAGNQSGFPLFRSASLAATLGAPAATTALTPSKRSSNNVTRPSGNASSSRDDDCADGGLGRSVSRKLSPPAAALSSPHSHLISASSLSTSFPFNVDTRSACVTSPAPLSAEMSDRISVAYDRALYSTILPLIAECERELQYPQLMSPCGPAFLAAPVPPSMERYTLLRRSIKRVNALIAQLAPIAACRCSAAHLQPHLLDRASSPLSSNRSTNVTTEFACPESMDAIDYCMAALIPLLDRLAFDWESAAPVPVRKWCTHLRAAAHSEPGATAAATQSRTSSARTASSSSAIAAIDPPVVPFGVAVRNALAALSGNGSSSTFEPALIPISAYSTTFASSNASAQIWYSPTATKRQRNTTLSPSSSSALESSVAAFSAAESQVSPAATAAAAAAAPTFAQLLYPRKARMRLFCSARGDAPSGVCLRAFVAHFALPVEVDLITDEAKRKRIAAQYSIGCFPALLIDDERVITAAASSTPLPLRVCFECPAILRFLCRFFSLHHVYPTAALPSALLEQVVGCIHARVFLATQNFLLAQSSLGTFRDSALGASVGSAANARISVERIDARAALIAVLRAIEREPWTQRLSIPVHDLSRDLFNQMWVPRVLLGACLHVVDSPAFPLRAHLGGGTGPPSPLVAFLASYRAWMQLYRIAFMV